MAIPKEKSYEKQKAKEIMDIAIMRKTADLVRAGLTVAFGNVFVYEVINGDHVLIKNPVKIARALDKISLGNVDPDGKYFYITTDKPDINAIDKLLNRPFGKPKETIENTGQIDFAKFLMEMAQRSLANRKARDEALKIEEKK